jgi:hypothetical protein
LLEPGPCGAALWMTSVVVVVMVLVNVGWCKDYLKVVHVWESLRLLLT